MKILFTTIFICCTMFIQAQIKMGLKAGLNVANIKVKNASRYEPKSGLHFGVVMNVPVAEKVSVQPEILFMQKGSDITYDSSFINGRARYNLNYFEIPVVVMYHPVSFLDLHLGIYGSYLAGVDVKSIGSEGVYDYRSLGRRDFNDFDYGMCIGAGARFNSLFAGARYSYGLVEAGDVGTYNGRRFIVADGTNRVTSFYLGFNF